MSDFRDELLREPEKISYCEHLRAEIERLIEDGHIWFQVRAENPDPGVEMVGHIINRLRIALAEVEYLNDANLRNKGPEGTDKERSSK